MFFNYIGFSIRKISTLDMNNFGFLYYNNKYITFTIFIIIIISLGIIGLIIITVFSLFFLYILGNNAKMSAYQLVLDEYKITIEDFEKDVLIPFFNTQSQLKSIDPVNQTSVSERP